MHNAIEEIGGEPLSGSGFENEKPDEAFSGAVLLPSTYLPGTTKASRSDQS
jgi:hypothetical protein